MRRKKKGEQCCIIWGARAGLCFLLSYKDMLVFPSMQPSAVLLELGTRAASPWKVIKNHRFSYFVCKQVIQQTADVYTYSFLLTPYYLLLTTYYLLLTTYYLLLTTYYLRQQTCWVAKSVADRRSVVLKFSGEPQSLTRPRNDS